MKRRTRTIMGSESQGGRAAVGSLLVALALPAVARAQPLQLPRFQTSVEVTSVDVTVVDGNGRPVTDLQPSDFTVRIQGIARRVVSAEWVSLVTPERPDAPIPPPGYSTNEAATGGRLIVFLVDQPNIRFGGAVGIRAALAGFLDRLQPSDRVAAVGVGPGSTSTPFTADRERVKQVIARMVGQGSMRSFGLHQISLSEAIAVQRGDFSMLDSLISRECADEPGPGLELCASTLQMEAERIASDGVADGEQTVNTLRALLTGLKTIEAPKTVVLVTEGFVMGDQRAPLVELGNLAAEARTSIYALKLDDPIFADITERRAPAARFQDRRTASEGLEALVSATRGALFNVVASADAAFARMESELAGYYLLGVEFDPIDKDGRAHPVRVQVNRPGALARSRRQLIGGIDRQIERSPSQVAMLALGSPLMVPGLPLRVATFSLQGPEMAKVQLRIHLSIGNDYSESRVVSVVYMITDRDGRIMQTLGDELRLFPLVTGVPSGLEFSGGASLPPGDYTLRVAVAEGDRVGTVEHPIHAGLVPADALNLSDLMVGGPAETRELFGPTIGHTVAYGAVHGYLEAYGPGAAALTAKYEIAAEAESPAILSASIPARPAGAERVIFSDVLLVRQLPPGPYVLRALVSSATGPVKTIRRAFEVAAPRVLMTSVEAGAGATPGPSELFLPAGDDLFARPFHADEAVSPETVRPFRERLTPQAARPFDQGLAFLVARDFPRAENSFKAAIEADPDNAAPVLAYLAVTFAAAGHSDEAASAWQTALIDGADLPQIYVWLGDALMRTRNLPQARAVLEEALKKWPADLRFAMPLAVLYATFGQGREALRTLERHLAAHPDDAEANYLGVEWTYHLHLSGAVSHSRAEDVKLARSYAAAYEKASGQRMPLIKEWMDFLEGRSR
jgi:VWFA-related protein